MFFAGLDVGSTMTKIVIRKDSGDYLSIIKPTGAEHRRFVDKVMTEALYKAKLSFEQIDYIVATGYGRVNVPFADTQLSEITCHMKGVNWLYPSVRTIIDIGGQDSKGIKVKNGKTNSFVMNDKCAAGTGRFLEVMAELLGMKLEEIGEMALRSGNPVAISKMCTVFARQEVLLRLSDGAALEDILAGLHQALAARIFSMVSKIGIEREVVLTGGGAKNAGLVKFLEERLGFSVQKPDEPLLTGALGASLAAQEIAQKAVADGAMPKQKNHTLTPASFFEEMPSVN
ncbi:acyl-CoA dehydratase activase [Desulfotomaculum copahuensis]|uniref:2-hydroxyglutaryl-CoA dehydratase n=1 Tax=Desulfotomaculum copahuensis TaxID=1838280 RepID=A0A1B7LDQ3_9FIRM|nr:acyl-CoA dehydratase activase [Desulfotomaculum copahuensis]OAT81227.1 2-hydroxyglutaryl-CoA dehydratase [Desulfotomaculum copahuensis]